MKKNISINISGILFYIEEDGYDRLKHYLDEIKRYFATYDDTGEIAADIENRVAEIFLSKLNPGKQVITAADVDSLITQMGNVQDFEAIEEPLAGTESSYTGPAGEHTYAGAHMGAEPGTKEGAGTAGTASATSNRRLYRDGKHKIIGGVAAGIAHYFRIDPLWIRLLFVAILFDFFISFSFSSALLIGYIILWIVVPERYDLREDKKIKKMFRNPDDKVIGGVAGGLAAYFGIDPSLIRILFVITTFIGGSGLIAYVVLWVIMPEAVTLTDKMQMQGEPVTLSNIEQNIKKNLNVREGEENTLVKALLLPFRLLSAIFSGAGRTLSPLIRFLGDAIRILAGIALILMGFAFLLILIMAGSFFGGFLPEVYFDIFDLNIPYSLIHDSVPALVLIAGFITLFIPGLAVMLLGIAIIAKRWLLNTAASWLLFALWIISIIILAISIPAYAVDFRTRDYYEAETTFTADSSQVLFLGLREVDPLDYDDVELTIKPSEEAALRLEQRFYAYGPTREEAMELASQSRYEVEQLGDTLLLSQHLSLPEGQPYRVQTLKASLYMPVGQRFQMDYSLRKVLSYTLTPHGYSVRDLRANPVFYFNEANELVCVGCPERKEKTYQQSEASGSTWGNDSQGAYTREIKAEGFKEVAVGSNYEVEFRQAPEYSIVLRGDEDAVNMVEFDQSGRRISFKNSMSFFDSNKGTVRISISLPELEELRLSGSSEAQLEGWSAGTMELDLSGSSDCRLSGNINSLTIDQSGSSQVDLRGQGETLRASLSGGSELNALDFPLQEASLSLSGSSQANVSPEKELNVQASGSSQVNYRGNPSTEINKSRGARVQKEE